MNFCAMVHTKYPKLFLFLQALLGNTRVRAHFLQLSVHTSSLSFSWQSEILGKKEVLHLDSPGLSCRAGGAASMKPPLPSSTSQPQDASPPYPRLSRGFCWTIHSRSCLGFSPSSLLQMARTVGNTTDGRHRNTISIVFLCL